MDGRTRHDQVLRPGHDGLGCALTEAAGRARRLRLVDAEQLLQPVLAHMRHAPGIEQLEVAGSFRRRKETLNEKLLDRAFRSCFVEHADMND